MRRLALPGRLPTRARAAVSPVAGVLLVCGLLAAGCTGSAEPTAASGSSTAAADGSPSTSATASATTSASAPVSPSPSASSPEPTEPALSPVPSRARKTLRPVPPSTPADVGGGVRLTLAGSRAVTVTGQGPGELSGPALAVTLRVANGSARPFALDGVTVSASIRDEEASPSASPPARPLSGSLRAGGTADGVYVFVLPEGPRRPVVVVASLSADLPVATFTIR
jgi:hypothetical protein